ncbi:MAG: cache domain-containing protein [Motiliproteus sp.]
MSLKTKIILLAIVPLLLVTISVTLIALKQAKTLGEQEVQTFERNLIASKEKELRHYVSLALTSIDHIYSNIDLHPEDAQARVKAILLDLTYGDDGYFFVYDDQGINLVHPIQPELAGQNMIDLQDRNGDFIIRNLLKRAQEGGGFHRYQWLKPSRDEIEDKLSYVVMLPHWNWMLGTGLYLDDIGREVTKIKAQVNQNIRNTFFTVLVITSITVVLIILFGIAFNIHEHRLADGRLRELVHRSLQFQIAERKRFSRELHDGINQLMVSVKYRLELAREGIRNSEDSAIAHLDQGELILNEAIREVRRISHDMRPTVLDDLGLIPTLNSLLDEYALRTGIRVEQQVELADRKLSEEIDITFYRVVQEALTNIERHADASHVWLRGRWQGDSFQLEIADNGCGFDTGDSKCADGIGLRNMRERIELLGGEFSIDTQRNNGTRIRAKLSLELYS